MGWKKERGARTAQSATRRSHLQLTPVQLQLEKRTSVRGTVRLARVQISPAGRHVTAGRTRLARLGWSGEPRIRGVSWIVWPWIGRRRPAGMAVPAGHGGRIDKLPPLIPLDGFAGAGRAAVSRDKGCGWLCWRARRSSGGREGAEAVCCCCPNARTTAEDQEKEQEGAAVTLTRLAKAQNYTGPFFARSSGTTVPSTAHTYAATRAPLLTTPGCVRAAVPDPPRFSSCTRRRPVPSRVPPLHSPVVMAAARPPGQNAEHENRDDPWRAMARGVCRTPAAGKIRPL